MKRTKKITLSALFCARSVVVLLVGSFSQVADIAISMAASAILMLGLIEMGQSFAVMIYFATSILSLLFSELLYCLGWIKAGDLTLKD